MIVEVTANVSGPVIVDVHLNGNATVSVIRPVDVGLHGSSRGSDHLHGGVQVHVHGHDHVSDHVHVFDHVRSHAGLSWSEFLDCRIRDPRGLY